MKDKIKIYIRKKVKTNFNTLKWWKKNQNYRSNDKIKNKLKFNKKTE